MRVPGPGDEAAARAAHAELAPDGFRFLLTPELTWAEQLDRLHLDSRGVDLRRGQVPADFLIADVAGDVVGRVSVRHTLTPLLLDLGGHVGYAVRPAYRGRGYASQMLRLSLERLAALGVSPALVTCDEDNAASRKVIERCGGRLQDVRAVAPGVPGKRRYWIELG